MMLGCGSKSSLVRQLGQASYQGRGRRRYRRNHHCAFPADQSIHGDRCDGLSPTAAEDKKIDKFYAINKQAAACECEASSAQASNQRTTGTSPGIKYPFTTHTRTHARTRLTKGVPPRDGRRRRRRCCPSCSNSAWWSSSMVVMPSATWSGRSDSHTGQAQNPCHQWQDIRTAVSGQAR